MKIITPWRLLKLNHFLRTKLHFDNSYWKIYGHWFVFKDHYMSETAEIVHREIVGGIYKPQIELKANDVVLDLGAHIGMFCIPLAKINPGVWFFAFESDPINYRRLLKNIKMNRVNNVFAYNEPVGKSGDLVVTRHDSKNTGGSWVESKNVKDALKCVSLEDIKRQLGMLDSPNGNKGRIRLLKMDIEGSEYDLITSPSQLVGIDNIIAEIHGGIIGKDNNTMRDILETVKFSNLTVIESTTFAYHSINGKPFQLGKMD